MKTRPFRAAFGTRAAVATALAVAGVTPAAAQTLGGVFLDSEIPFDVSRGQNVSVRERERPDYEASGVHAGGFTLYPRIRVGAGYSDNVFGVENNPIDDGFLVFDPSISAESNWSRHYLAAEGGFAFRRFLDQSIKNENGARAALRGRLDIGDSNITTALRAVRAYEPQYSGAFPNNVAEPIEYNTRTAEIRGTYQGARFRAILSGDANRITFENTRALDGSVIDQQSRDRTIGRASGRIEFAATPDTAAFVQYTYADSNYDDTFALGGVFNRDSQEQRWLGGATFDLSSLVRGAVGVGYVDRDYDSPVYGSISGLAADVRLDWFMTQLTTVSFNFKRQIEDSITPGSGGYFATGGIARIDHELRRNVILNVEGGYERDTFKGISRRDDLWRVSGGADYFFTRNWGANASLQYLDRNSKGQPQGQSFNEVRALLSLLYQI